MTGSQPGGVTQPDREAVVSVVETAGDIRAAVEEAMEAAGWREAVPEGAAVAIKPNLGWDLFLPGAVTSAVVVDAVIRKLRTRAGKLYLVEADQVLVRCESALRQTGMDRLCVEHGVEWVNLSRSPFVRVPVPGFLRVAELEIPEILTRTVLVTVPVMKTHNKTVLTGAIKNQWGCLPKFRHNFHPVVDEVLRDLSSVLRPAFTVCDATVCLEGNGPKSGRPKICNLVLASRDPVALDTIASRIMDLDRFTIRHLDLCAQAGVGTRDPKLIRTVDRHGRDRSALPRIPFTPARHNAVSQVETVLRSSIVRRLVFQGPMLALMCWGARLWYYIWYYLIRGRKLRDGALRTHPWGSSSGMRPRP